jgi:hypothetical protein
MASIVETIVGSKSLRLGNEEFLRQLSFGTDWQSIRIGLRWGAVMSSTIASSQFVVGVNAGTAEGYRSTNTVEFIGAQMSHATVAWTYNAGGGNPYFSTAYARRIKRIAGVSTISDFNYGAAYGPILPNRSLFFVDIMKNFSANNVGTLTSYPGSAVQAQTDLSLDLFYRFLEVDQLPYSGSWAIDGATVQSIPYNGLYPFDSVSVSWNDNAQPIEIFDLVVVRFA